MKFALQILYVVLGLGVNAMSLLYRRRTGRTLTPVDPRGGFAVMALYAMSATGNHLKVPGAGAALLVLLVIIGYGGIYDHLRRPATEYATRTSRWTAIAINAFGVLITATVLLS
ncbi:MAG: hypothetical protein ABI831_17670 [Betaproteobacteria bacterium]